MKQVIRLDLVGQEKQEEKALKPVEITHELSTKKGWIENRCNNSMFSKVSYLGCCKEDGDMFMEQGEGYIRIFKGHLNDGVY